MTSRVESTYCPIAATRNAEVSSIGRLTSVVTRNDGCVPAITVAVANGVRVGTLLTWLITPPVDPRPNSIDDGPCSTSTASSEKTSR